MFGHRFFSFRYFAARYFAPRRAQNVVAVSGAAVGRGSAVGVVAAAQQRVGPHHVHFGPVELPGPYIIRVAGRAVGRGSALAAASAIISVSAKASGRARCVGAPGVLQIHYLEFSVLDEGRGTDEFREFGNDEGREFGNDEDVVPMRRAA